ncbi:protein FLX-like 3 [Nymphaea colorata]|nr:protein FLX-like 3 [Nymphaea colorata]XP_031476840.1 protein FLX-like 3 [Nymphaea colorata]XP_031476841.1 protein FLX-like 3 [Nymphaea colorata]XP_031476842.1 protein FLX-like 3 [Nymphaea colorata]XP_031476843.1 protein FLX-like 3 [Nymphaea colorata]XP_031476844.1 protein FLX-like 3 [Nymphaea colorata]XP_031476845.1 protein FLX-like 3 [Nymphaea colorata]XP_049932347.1 protein FLX-like 3 [Nymphaea colorata]XP_049932348.1 protein FLX-like 3 [Nymphaea colorata]XP_049932349.1 protein FLX-li
MAGRGRLPRHVAEGSRGFHPGIRDVPSVGRRLTPHPAILEEELEIQTEEIRRLLLENRRLAEDRAGMYRDIAFTKDELHRLNFLIADIRTEKEFHARELIEKGLKLEADLRATEPLRLEVLQRQAEVKKLTALRQELGVQVQNLSQDLARAQAENQQIPHLRADIDGLRQELAHARMAFEAEKKASIELMEQKQAMEKNLVSMAREIEKIRVDIAGSDHRPWAAGGSYGTKVGSPEMGYAGPYGDGYGLSSVVGDKGHSFGIGSNSYALDKSRLAHR